MSGQVRVGVVGAGWWSSFAHLPALVNNPAAEIVVICDRDQARADEAAAMFDVPHAVTSVEEMLSLGIDAAIVATPQNSHHLPASILLDAGVDVLVEKPMTVDSAQAWDLVERARKSGARLHVGHTFPHSSELRELRRMIEAGDLGELTLLSGLFATAVEGLYRGETAFAQENTGAPFAAVSTTYSDPNSGGQLFSQSSHAVAVLLFLAQDNARTVTCFENRANLAVDLADAIATQLESGAIATLASTGNVDQNDLRREEYRLFGTNGSAILDTTIGSLQVLLNGREPILIERSPNSLNLSWAPAQNLIAAAQGREEVVVSGELGATVIDLLCAARLSATSGGIPISARHSQTPIGRQ